MANSFEHISIAAIKVLAKQAALRLVKDELQRQGIRVHSVPARDIQISAIQYVDDHPELIEQAAERVAAHPEWLPKRARPPVAQSDHATGRTDIVGEKSTTSAIFRR
jgi:hypothetical protein